MDSRTSLRNNKAIAMLDAAVKGRYGVPAVVVYNLEGIVATVRAAEAKRSPAMLLLFPWAQTYSHTLLAAACHQACRTAKAPITLHLDHAQSPKAIKEAADMGFYDSIMIDMSHYEKEENLALTKDLTAYCHQRGIATEAEPGRIEGGEDGISDTADLAGLLTSPEEAEEFVDTGIDWLAPAFGNVHGNYGARGIILEYDRLEAINNKVGKKVRLVLHGTDGFDKAVFKQCIDYGISKVNINKAVNRAYTEMQKQGEYPITQLMEKGTEEMQRLIEKCMDDLGSTGKAK